MKRIIVTLVIAVMLFTGIPLISPAGNNDVHASTYSGTYPRFFTGAELIVSEAMRLSWPYGTSSAKYAYKGGSALGNYQQAIENVYPSRGSWEKGVAAGASCVILVGCVLKGTGYDPNYVKTPKKQFAYFEGATNLYKTVEYTGSTSVMKPGDIIRYDRKDGGTHIYIYVGDGKRCDAAYYKTYAKCVSISSSYASMSNKTRAEIFRPIGPARKYFQKGDSGQQIIYLQQYLNWAGYDCGEPDGAFGKNTQTAVKNFQAANGLEADGIFDEECLMKAQGISLKKPYAGNFPTKKIYYHHGSKNNIKRWQKYLAWYGYDLDIDGGFGKTTVALTKKFQKENKLTADGRVGSKTLAVAKKIKR